MPARSKIASQGLNAQGEIPQDGFDFADVEAHARLPPLSTLFPSSSFDSHQEAKLELPGQAVPKPELGNERKKNPQYSVDLDRRQAGSYRGSARCSVIGRSGLARDP
jgi:hypothetical protein